MYEKIPLPLDGLSPAEMALICAQAPAGEADADTFLPTAAAGLSFSEPNFAADMCHAPQAEIPPQLKSINKNIHSPLLVLLNRT